MTETERGALRAVSSRIKELASLENCGCSEKTKEDIRLYMDWFNTPISYLDKLIEIDEKCESYDKRILLEKIIRHCS